MSVSPYAADDCFRCGPEPVRARPAPHRDSGIASVQRRSCPSCDRAFHRGYPMCAACEAVLLRVPGFARYCSRCPGEGKVEIVLVHPEDGRERSSWHPTELVQALDAARGPAKRVLTAASDRDWRVGRVTRRVGAPKRAWRTLCVCKHCGQDWLALVAADNAKPKTCPECRREQARRHQRAYRRRLLAETECRSCGIPGVQHVAESLCWNCLRRGKVHGFCPTCRDPLSKDKHTPKPWCPRCEVPPRRRGMHVLVTVIDGQGRSEQRWVGALTPLGPRAHRRWARSWAGPVVLVPRLGVRTLQHGVVISGLFLLDTGPATRSLLPGLVARPTSSWRELLDRVKAELGAVPPPAAQLLRAGMVDEDGRPTERARGVVRWAELAGVKL